MQANTTGNSNTANGNLALAGNTSGYNNTAEGYGALAANTTGFYNTAGGYQAAARTTGSYNSAYGEQALFQNVTGAGNAAFGFSAMTNNVSGSHNVAVGDQAFFASNNLDNTVCIGNLSGTNSSVSNRIEIGNSSIYWIGGQVTWGTYSDERIKDNVQADVPGLSFITKLRPVTYNLNIHRENDIIYKGTNKDATTWDSKYDIEKMKVTGFLAQEVEKAAKESGYDFSGVQVPANADELYTLRYSDFVMPLVKAVQELARQNDEMKKEIDALKNGKK